MSAGERSGVNSDSSAECEDLWFLVFMVLLDHSCPAARQRSIKSVDNHYSRLGLIHLSTVKDVNIGLCPQLKTLRNIKGAGNFIKEIASAFGYLVKVYSSSDFSSR